MTLPPTIAAEAAITRQNVALSSLKRSADAEKQIANLLDKAIDNVPTSSIRGNTLNTKA